jgi:hypothetical protein
MPHKHDTTNPVLSALLAGCLALATAGCPEKSGEQTMDSPRVEEVDMRDYLWENRPVLVFGPAENDVRYRRQMQEFVGQDAELQDRDIVLFALPWDGPRSIDGQSLTASASDPLWQQFEVATDSFAVILVGKDGGVKLRSEEPVAVARIFDVIDAMPMRQAEMRRKAASDEQ